MAVVPGHGGVLKSTIAASLTIIAQTEDVQIGESASQVMDTETTDDAGPSIRKTNLLMADQEDITSAILYDPDGATHKHFTNSIAAPAAFPIAGSVVFADATPASATFSAVGFGFSAGFKVKDVLRGRIRIMTNGLVVWPA